jgi:hypothetical protein
VTKQHEQFVDNTLNARTSPLRAEPFEDIDINTFRAQRSRTAADELSLIRIRLASSAAGHLQRAAEQLVQAGNRPLGDDGYRQFRSSVARVVDHATTDAQLAKLEDEFRSRASVEVKPVDPYAKGSPHSWVQDVLADSDSSPLATPADHDRADRLQRHAAIVTRAIDKRTRYGKALIRAHAEESRRDEDPVVGRQRVERELRALTTGGGATASASGGTAAFTTPAILLDEWAKYRSPAATFIAQCDDSVELPPYGLNVYVPIVTTGTTVATDTEGSATSEGDPATSYASGAIVQKAGQLTVSQAVLDRVGPGISGDVVLFQQLKNQLAAQVDAYALTLVIANAATVTNSGSFALATTSGVGGFLGDVKKAKAKLTDTAGVRLRGTHVFALDDFVDFIGSYADAQARPVFSPAFDDNRLPIKSVGDGLAEGYSGYVVNGLALFGNSNIPNSSSNIQLVVCRPDTILHLEGPPVAYCYPQGAAAHLEAILGVRQYCTTIAKFATGVAVISGAAYAATNFR